MARVASRIASTFSGVQSIGSGTCRRRPSPRASEMLTRALPRFSLTVMPERQPSWERLWERPVLRTVTQALERGMGEIWGEIPPHRLARCGIGSQRVAPLNSVPDYVFARDPRRDQAFRNQQKASFGSTRSQVRILSPRLTFQGLAQGGVPKTCPKPGESSRHLGTRAQDRAQAGSDRQSHLCWRS